MEMRKNILNSWILIQQKTKTLEMSASKCNKCIQKILFPWTIEIFLFLIPNGKKWPSLEMLGPVGIFPVGNQDFKLYKKLMTEIYTHKLLKLDDSKFM